MNHSNPHNQPPSLIRAIPNDRWEILLHFNNGEHRIFKVSVARNEKGFAFLSNPQKSKAFTFTPDYISWGSTYRLTTAYLFERSEPINPEKLARQYLGIGSKNQAPTSEHPTHHIYIVGIFPFNQEVSFSIGESIHGGHADTGGSRSYSLAQLLNKEDWLTDFERADCEWAIPIIQSFPAEEKRVDSLIDELAAELQRRLRDK